MQDESHMSWAVNTQEGNETREGGSGDWDTFKMGVGVRIKEKAKVEYSLFDSSDGIGA